MSPPKLSDNALIVLKKRGYLLKKGATRLRPPQADYGEAHSASAPLELRRDTWETPDEMFRRVAKLIASADKGYQLASRRSGHTADSVRRTEEDFYRMMSLSEYLSGSVLLNASRKRKQFSACYVLPLTDSLEDIYDQLRNAALIARTGGGIGIPLTNLRPRGSHVTSTGGISSGAVSFLRLFNYSASTISEASVRRPAMMGVLKVDHPDIVEFIMAKEDPSTLYHFNISVGATNEFMDRVKRGKGTIHLFHPNDGETERDMDVMELWNLIATQAWKVGDPGMVFLDRMNKDCPIPKLGRYETTNPCGEQPLLPYESCNLGNINLGRFVKKVKRVQSSESSKAKLHNPIELLSLNSDHYSIDWSRLEDVVRLGVHFQDNVIDLCDYPIPELADMAKMTRKIGLGVMGWADMLVKLGVRYDSNEALKLAERISKFIQNVARDESVNLAKQRGSFPAFEESTWKKRGFSHMRNSTVNTIAPTGTISIIAGCSSGIEPLFALVYRKENILDLGKTSLLEVNEEFEAVLKDVGARDKKTNRQIDKWISRQEDNRSSPFIHSSIHPFIHLSDVQSILDRVSQTGSCQDIDGLPQSIKDTFRVSMEIPYEWHIKMQAAWQKYTDSAVSKTINLPNSATVEDIKKAYLLAYETGCKGITVYRDGCRDEQVLNVGGDRRPTNDDGCPECHGELMGEGGCVTCTKCGWSKCSV